MNDTPFAHTSLTEQLDAQLVQRAMALIEPAQRIALLAHEHPDGDCIGSALGFAHILRQIGKTCTPVCADAAPGTLSFMPGIETLQTSLGDEQFDLVIALDAGEITRFGGLYTQHQAFLDRVPIVNIDHHISSSGCGVVNIIDPQAAATAELITLFQQQTGLPLNQDAAQCLLTGVITDTRSFQYTSTTPRTLVVGAVLLSAGALPETIAKAIYYTRPVQQVRFQAAVIANMQTACDGRLAWSYATYEMLLATGATAEMDDNFAGMLRDIEGVQIAAFFKSYGELNSTSLSLRCAAPYNAANICVRFGGGGHARAAGATIQKPCPEAIADVIAALKQEIADEDIK
jgi:phosphoesterase RecJ-like protein